MSPCEAGGLGVGPRASDSLSSVCRIVSLYLLLYYPRGGKLPSVIVLVLELVYFARSI